MHLGALLLIYRSKLLAYTIAADGGRMAAERLHNTDTEKEIRSERDSGTPSILGRGSPFNSLLLAYALSPPFLQHLLPPAVTARPTEES